MCRRGAGDRGRATVAPSRGRASDAGASGNDPREDPGGGVRTGGAGGEAATQAATRRVGVGIRDGSTRAGSAEGGNVRS